MPTRGESTFDEVKRYARFGEEDAALLRALYPFAAPHLRSIAEQFYERTREHEDAHAVFVDEAQIARLKLSLERWMQGVLEGPHDDAYYERHRQIGRVHVRIGLAQRYMFTSMSVVRVALGKVIDDAPLDDALRSRTHLAMNKVLDVELAVMLETYADALLERVRKAEAAQREGLTRALERSERRHAHALAVAPVVAVGFDSRGAITLFNRAAEASSGYARDEALGADFFELLLPTDLRDEARERASRWLEKGLEADAPDGAPWELVVRTRAGRARTVRFRVARLDTEAGEGTVNGDDTSLVLLGEDVTESRELAERTLRHEKLAAVGTLAAGLAHEIRNPLNGALLHLTFLERAIIRGQAQTPAATEAVGVVAGEIKRLGTLVSDFLVFARPAPPRLAPGHIGPVVTHAVSLVEAEAAAAKVTVRVDLGPSAEVSLMIDAEKLEQAVLNLLRNAIEAVGSTGGGGVEVRTRRRPRHVDVEVEDEGPGLPSTDAPVFDAFYSTKPQGTGLGLSIVQRIVSDHGGHVSVISRPGHTVFRIELPVPLESTTQS